MQSRRCSLGHRLGDLISAFAAARASHSCSPAAPKGWARRSEFLRGIFLVYKQGQEGHSVVCVRRVDSEPLQQCKFGPSLLAARAQLKGDDND
jgi:hypothetical protein